MISPMAAQGGGPLLDLGEGDGDEGQSRRRQQGTERALEGPGPEQHGGVDGRTTQGRGPGEAEQPDDEHPLATHVVGDASAQQEQAAEGQGVGGHDPLPVVG
jgi:hypothetical protein